MPFKTRASAVRRPKQRRSRATVAIIIEDGARILAENGWAAFNTNSVAARAGVSVGSVYEYFADKQALIDAIADRHLLTGEKLLELASTQLSEKAQLEEIADSLIRGFVYVHEADPRLHRVLSSEVPLSESVRHRVQLLRLGIIDAVSKALSYHLPEPGIAAQVLVDTADAVTHRWLIEDDGALAAPDRLTTEIKKMFSAYLTGLCHGGQPCVP